MTWLAAILLIELTIQSSTPFVHGIITSVAHVFTRLQKWGWQGASEVVMIDWLSRSMV